MVEKPINVEAVGVGSIAMQETANHQFCKSACPKQIFFPPLNK